MDADDISSHLWEKLRHWPNDKCQKWMSSLHSEVKCSSSVGECWCRWWRSNISTLESRHQVILLLLHGNTTSHFPQTIHLAYSFRFRSAHLIQWLKIVLIHNNIFLSTWSLDHHWSSFWSPSAWSQKWSVISKVWSLRWRLQELPCVERSG